jgi:hypothetical protein
MDREFMNVYFVGQGADLLLYPGSGRNSSPVLKWVANRLYQRNATLNAFHECLKRYYDVRALSGRAYDAAVAQYRDYRVEDEVRTVVNLTGKLALSSVCPKSYWFDDFDSERLEARRRLVLLELALLERKLPKTAYPAVLETSDMGLRDPVTGAPAKWDQDNQIVYFEREKGCLSDGHWISLGPPRSYNRCRPPGLNQSGPQG